MFKVPQASINSTINQKRIIKQVLPNKFYPKSDHLKHFLYILIIKRKIYNTSFLNKNNREIL